MNNQINRVFALQKLITEKKELEISEIFALIKLEGFDLNLRTLQRDMILLLQLDSNITHVRKSRYSIYKYIDNNASTNNNIVTFGDDKVNAYYLKGIFDSFISKKTSNKLKKLAKKIDNEYPADIFLMSPKTFHNIDESITNKVNDFINYIIEGSWIQINYMTEEGESQTFKAFPKHIQVIDNKIKAVVYLPLLSEYYTLEIRRIVESYTIKQQKYNIPLFDLRELKN